MGLARRQALAFRSSMSWTKSCLRISDFGYLRWFTPASITTVEAVELCWSNQLLGGWCDILYAGTSMNPDSATYRSTCESAPSVLVGGLMGPLCHSALDKNAILTRGRSRWHVDMGTLMWCGKMWENKQYTFIKYECVEAIYRLIE